MLPAHRSRVRHSVLFAIFSVVVCVFPFERAFADNVPPNSPGNPDPWIGVLHVPLDFGSVWLTWDAFDPDDGINMTFDVYLGTNPTPPLVKVNGTFSNNDWKYRASALSYNTTYYWRVVMHDPHGAETSGPTWWFKTKLQNEPPEAPYLPTPDVGAVEIPVNPSLTWWGFDVDGDVVDYDIYLGTDPDPPLLDDHFVQTRFMANPVPYRPAQLLTPEAVYYWRVVARDNGGLLTSSPVWSFTTANTANQIPTIPWDHLPPGQAETATPVLYWSASDPDGEALTFDVYLRMFPNPAALVGTTTETMLQVGPLVPHKQYYWYVVAKDSYWSAIGPTWSLAYGSTPVLFSHFEARQNGDDVDVRWSLASDEAMKDYTLFRREASSPSVAIARGAVRSVEGAYRDTSVMAGKTYQYELVIRTTDGDEFRSQTATVTMPATGITLHQNVPNPFNPQTTIRYDLPSSARVRLSVVDVAGRHVRTLVDEQQTAGARSVVWAGRDDMGRPVSSGVYFYVLDAGKTRLTKKLVLLK